MGSLLAAGRAMVQRGIQVDKLLEGQPPAHVDKRTCPTARRGWHATGNTRPSRRSENTATILCVGLGLKLLLQHLLFGR